MPVKLEKALRKSARKKFGTTTSKRAQRYIYGSEPMQKYLKKKHKKK